MERFAHSHEDEIAKAGGILGAQDLFDLENLGDDFGGAKVAFESHLSGGTKNATHGASDLGADASGGATDIGHEHGFDSLSVGELEEEFTGETIGTCGIGDGGWSLEKKAISWEEFRFDPAGEWWEEGWVMGKVGAIFAVNRPPKGLGVNRAESVGDKDIFEVRKKEIVQGSHGAWARNAKERELATPKRGRNYFCEKIANGKRIWQVIAVRLV
jgi:hypothetical protein